VGGADQGTHAPGGGDAEGDQESQTDEAAGTIGFAPRLEHGDQSNREQHDGGDGENLDPHGDLPWPLSLAVCHWHSLMRLGDRCL
jgi:hypothetical protein